ncbi:hypothetical protein BFP75_11010 [Maribacter sp. 4G9]|nr:hypothetical protein BFP75_11010 [Maribacter sp. 4G9]
MFVYNLIQQFCKLGHKVTVISPDNIMSVKVKKVKSYGEELCTVYRPKVFSLSSIQLGSFNTYRIAELAQIRAIQKTVKNNNIEFDFVYAHFLMNGIVAVNALNNYAKPVFTAIGESDLTSFTKRYPKSYFNRSVKRINGFVAVSNKLKDQLIGYGVTPERILMKPNAVDLNKFYSRDKKEMRVKYELPMDVKLIAFVGRFMHHKGPLRVLDAVNELDNVGILFIGSGPQNPEGKSVVFKGSLPSYKIPEILSAADLFVLPTQKEGSCNAIAEAVACGLPVVSSDIPEVRDQCDSSYSILVDPLDVDAIRIAIDSIVNNQKVAKEMSDNALRASKNFEIGERAAAILSFIKGMMKSQNECLKG